MGEREHELSLPPLATAEVEALRRAIEEINKTQRLSYSKISSRIREFSEDSASRFKVVYDGRTFPMSDYNYSGKQLDSFVKHGVAPKAKVSNAILRWLYHFYRPILDGAYYKCVIRGREPFVEATRQLLKDKPKPLDRAKIDVWAGTYCMFRPFFGRPEDEVMVSRLEIGADSSKPYDVSITNAFKDYDLVGGHVSERLRGKLVPSSTAALLLVRFSAFAFFTGTIYNRHVNTKHKVDKMDGYLVAMTTPGTCISCPFYAVRQELVDLRWHTPQVATKDQLFKEVTDKIGM